MSSHKYRQPISPTANNHCLDRGQKGLERTLHQLDSLQILSAGTYRDSTDRHHRYPLLLQKNGFRIALLNYTYGTNGLRPKAPNQVNYLDRRQMLKDIHTAQAWRPDVLIAYLHWGNEYQQLPSHEQQEWADWLFAKGVDHIIGSHPHVVQPMEVRTDSLSGDRHLLVYSLGPRIRLASCSYDLVWTGRPTLTGKKNFILYPVTIPVDSLSTAARNRLKIFTENTRKLFSKYNKGIGEQTK